MTVQEILAAMIGAFRGFDNAAVLAMQPVFEQKLAKYEGPELRNAWIEVASSFKRTAATPYPMPHDFEQVLPRAAKIKGGPALDREGHRTRKDGFLADWRQWERPAIETAYGPRVAFWCESEVRSRADTLAWRTDEDAPKGIRLAAADVAKIIESVVSRDRMATFGAAVLDKPAYGEAAREQFEACRVHVLAGRFSYNEIAEPVKPKATRPGPTVDLRPDEFVEVGEPPPWVTEGTAEHGEVPE